jgi:hypothetical protein
MPRLALLDSVTQTGAAHADCVVVTGSHGGASVVRYARAAPAFLFVFNDAGIGKDGAGIAALDMLAVDGIAAVAVSHDSARIGEAQDTWDHGVVSAVNAPAQRLGLAAGQSLRAAVAPLLTTD